MIREKDHEEYTPWTTIREQKNLCTQYVVDSTEEKKKKRSRTRFRPEVRGGEKKKKKPGPGEGASCEGKNKGRKITSDGTIGNVKGRAEGEEQKNILCITFCSNNNYGLKESEKKKKELLVPFLGSPEEKFGEKNPSGHDSCDANSYLLAKKRGKGTKTQSAGLCRNHPGLFKRRDPPKLEREM